MLIYLLRHGRAEDGFGKPDEERALTSDGEERLRAAAPAWHKLLPPLDVVFQSSLRRAQETAAILLELAVRGSPELRTTDLIAPGGSIRETLRLIEEELASDTTAIAFVGHEPHLGCVLAALLTGDVRRSIPLKKGMLVAVELASRASTIGELRLALPQRVAADLG